MRSGSLVEPVPARLHQLMCLRCSTRFVWCLHENSPQKPQNLQSDSITPFTLAYTSHLQRLKRTSC